jgi:hypothetical protein
VILQGEALAVMVGAGLVGGSGQPGLGRWPGPGWLLGVRAPASSVGRDGAAGPGGVGLFLARPARLGLRPVLCVTLAVVGDHRARARLQVEFGLPAEVGRLSWVVDGPDRRLTWAERELVISARGARVTVPFVVRLSLAQHRADGLLLSPVRGAGLARPVVAAVEAGGSSLELAGLAGRHRGMLLSGVHLVVRPGHRPSRVFSGVRAAAITAEPAGRGVAAFAGSRCSV